jgi:hypothetical protein
VARTHYMITSRDRQARVIAPTTVVPEVAGGHTCVRMPSLAAGVDHYTIIEITTDRPQFHGTTYVHVALDHTNTPHVIGVWRS